MFHDRSYGCGAYMPRKFMMAKFVNQEEFRQEEMTGGRESTVMLGSG